MEAKTAPNDSNAVEAEVKTKFDHASKLPRSRTSFPSTPKGGMR